MLIYAARRAVRRRSGARQCPAVSVERCAVILRLLIVVFGCLGNYALGTSANVLRRLSGSMTNLFRHVSRGVTNGAARLFDFGAR
jgi:hypothetical protein